MKGQESTKISICKLPVSQPEVMDPFISPYISPESSVLHSWIQQGNETCFMKASLEVWFLGQQQQHCPGTLVKMQSPGPYFVNQNLQMMQMQEVSYHCTLESGPVEKSLQCSLVNGSVPVLCGRYLQWGLHYYIFCFLLLKWDQTK